jgi:hypothetical protein
VALVYTTAEETSMGRIPRQAIASTVIRTFENGIRSRRSLP